MEKRGALARAWSYLNFKPVAKWVALTAAVATAFLYVALLFLLLLFTDLMVSRGRIPGFTELTTTERDIYFDRWQRLDRDERKRCLVELLDIRSAEADAIAGAEEPSKLRLPAQMAIYGSYVYHLLGERVGPEAADRYREQFNLKPEVADPAYFGVLSLVVRSVNNWPIHRGVSFLARWNAWMWQTDSAIPYLSGLLALAVGVALLRSLLGFVMHYTAAVATIEAATRLRRAIYHHTFRLGTLAVRALGPSEAVSLFTRHVEAVHDLLYAGLTSLVRQPATFVLVLAFALVVNFWLALAFLIFALLVWLVGGQVANYYGEKGRGATRTAANQLALLQESLMLMRLVKCYLMELFNQARVERQLSAYARSMQSRSVGEAVYRPLLAFLAMLAAVSLLYVVGLIVLDGRLSAASAIVLVTSLIALYWPLEGFLENLRLWRRGRESAAVVFKFLDRPGEVGQAVGAEFLPPLTKLLEFDDVSLREPGTGRMLLRGVTLTVRAGQRIALVGPDDMAKHALVYLIPRFLDPTGGEIRIDQHNLRWVTLDSLRAQTAVVLQHNLVFNDTVHNNIGCGDAAYNLPQIIEAAKLAHAHHFIQKLPQGYETPIGEMGHALNMGEQFRIALARAILRDPALLIVEEPPAHLLDEDTAALIDDTFQRVLPGRTAIFLPHRLATIQASNQILLLNKGSIEAAGEHRQLLEHSELYRHLHYLEFNMFATQF